MSQDSETPSTLVDGTSSIPDNEDSAPSTPTDVERVSYVQCPEETIVYFHEIRPDPSRQNWPDPIDPIPASEREASSYYFVVSSNGLPYWIRGDGLDARCARTTWMPLSIAKAVWPQERWRSIQFWRYVYQD